MERGMEGKIVQVENLPGDISSSELAHWQRQDSSFKYVWETALQDLGKGEHPQGVFFLAKEGVLYQQDSGTQMDLALCKCLFL